MANIGHTLWVFDAGVRDRFKTVPATLDVLNNRFLANCLGPAGTDTITAAVARLAPGATITPGPFDAVVYLVNSVSRSLATRIGTTAATATSNTTVAGTTFQNQPGGDLAEVYWDRCFSDAEAAAAIFHEAAHLKSGLDNAMHTAVVGSPHGGPGLRVLRAKSSVFVPSFDDLEFYSAAITRRITLRRTVP